MVNSLVGEQARYGQSSEVNTCSHVNNSTGAFSKSLF